MGGACCSSCAVGKPCEGSCGASGDHAHDHADGADDAPKGAGMAAPLAPGDRHPIVSRARSVTGAHAAATAEIPRASGDAASDADRDAFLRSIQGLPEAERGPALREYMRARGASEDAINVGLLALARSGVDGVSAYFRQDFDRDVQTMREGNITERERLRQEGETARAELCYRYGGASCGAAGGTPPPPPPPPPPQHQQPAPTPANTDTMVMLLGLLAVGAVGYAVVQSGKRGG